MNKVLICGSRDWADRPKVVQVVRKLPRDTLVITGGAQGADTMAATAARENDLHVAVIKPLWLRGKRAGIDRNCAMLDLEPDKVIAFSHGSRGTQHTINEARRRGISVKVYGKQAPPPPTHQGPKPDPSRPRRYSKA